MPRVTYKEVVRSFYCVAESTSKKYLIIPIFRTVKHTEGYYR